MPRTGTSTNADIQMTNGCYTSQAQSNFLHTRATTPYLGNLYVQAIVQPFKWLHHRFHHRAQLSVSAWSKVLQNQATPSFWVVISTPTALYNVSGTRANPRTFRFCIFASKIVARIGKSDSRCSPFTGLSKCGVRGDGDHKQASIPASIDHWKCNSSARKLFVDSSTILSKDSPYGFR